MISADTQTNKQTDKHRKPKAILVYISRVCLAGNKGSVGWSNKAVSELLQDSSANLIIKHISGSPQKLTEY